MVAKNVASKYRVLGGPRYLQWVAGNSAPTTTKSPYIGARNYPEALLSPCHSQRDSLVFGGTCCVHKYVSECVELGNNPRFTVLECTSLFVGKNT